MRVAGVRLSALFHPTVLSEYLVQYFQDSTAFSLANPSIFESMKDWLIHLDVSQIYPGIDFA